MNLFTPVFSSYLQKKSLPVLSLEGLFFKDRIKLPTGYLMKQ
tara:strand:- start:86 stop:211 length:126 start_codon:yes stop_codon:yes gene_type:complete